MEKLSNALFEEIVTEAGEACLVLFYRQSCHVCKGLKEMLAEIAPDYPDIGFYQVDAEEEKALFARYNLKGVPQTLFFRDGEVKARISGEGEEQEYLDALDALTEG